MTNSEQLSFSVEMPIHKNYKPGTTYIQRLKSQNHLYTRTIHQESPIYKDYKPETTYIQGL